MDDILFSLKAFLSPAQLRARKKTLMILKTQTPNPFFSIRIYEGGREICIIPRYTQVE